MQGVSATQQAFTPPKYNSSSFHCPFCNVFANQSWNSPNYELTFLQTCFCAHCKKLSVWAYQKMVFPNSSSVSSPNPDLPENIKEIYLEAASILQKSPRGAAALLRLGIQELCKHLGEKGKNINQDIGSLVKKGLDKKIQQALDIVRVVGNNALHPGQIEIKDNDEVAKNLFGLVNIISEEMITRPKNIDAAYSKLIPESTKEAIKKRDKQENYEQPIQ